MLKKSRFAVSLVALGAAASMLLAACSGGGDTPKPGADGKLTKAQIILNWYPYGEHAGFYYGVQEGIFEKHGIDLTITPGGGSSKTAQAIGLGEAEFGWADTPAVLANIEKGVEIKSVGVFLQETPSAVQFFTDSGIKTAEDLKGKTIAVSAGDAPTTTFPIFLEASGLSESDVRTENLDSAGKVAALLSDQVDGLIGFAHDQGPTIADKSGREVSYLRYADAGLSFYSNGLLASDSTIKDNPDLVKAMVAATSEAHAEAMKNPEDAAKAMEGKDPQLPSVEVLTEQWKATSALLNTPNTKGKAPGVNAEEDWKNTLEVLSGSGLIEGKEDLDFYFNGSFAPGK